MFSTYGAAAPSLYLDIDREKAQALGITINDVFTTLQTTLGGFSINNFNLFSRTWQVNLQGEAANRRDVSNLWGIYIQRQRRHGADAASTARCGSRGLMSPGGHNSPNWTVAPGRVPRLRQRSHERAQVAAKKKDRRRAVFSSSIATELALRRSRSLCGGGSGSRRSSGRRCPPASSPRSKVREPKCLRPDRTASRDLCRC